MSYVSSSLCIDVMSLMMMAFLSPLILGSAEEVKVVINESSGPDCCSNRTVRTIRIRPLYKL